MSDTAKKQIAKAKAGLALSAPFFASLAFRLRYIPDPTIPTACTDGVSIRYSPAFIDSLSVEETKGLIAHEALHCALLHFDRLKGRDHRLWNMAGDYAINLILHRARFTLPEGALLDHQYDGMSTEEIYARLAQDPPNPDPIWNIGGVEPPPGSGESEGAGSGSGDANPEVTRGWIVAAAQAAQQARAMGRLPAGMDRFLEGLTAPRIDPASVLAEFIEQSAANDYSFARFNRRLYPFGIYMPGMRSDTLPPIVLVNDTSGSRGDEQLREFCGFVSEVLSRWQCEITVLHVDCEVARVEELTSADLPLRLKPAGGGGTDFRAAFDWVEQSGREYAAMVYLTDMWGQFPHDAPPYPVIWISDSGVEDAPFGRAVVV